MRTSILSLLFLLVVTAVNAQSDTSYFDANYEPIDSANAEFYRVMSKDVDGVLIMDYYRSGKKKMMARCSDTKPMLKNGPCAFYTKTGAIDGYGNYKDNNPVGIWVWRDENGKDSTVIDYKADGTKHYVHRSAQNEEVGDMYVISEVPPEFPGGEDALLNYLVRNYKISKAASKGGKGGRVYVEFVISETGKVEDVKVKRGVSPECDQEAIRVIQNMPNWKPGMQNGKPVKVLFNLPIKIDFN